MLISRKSALEPPDGGIFLSSPQENTPSIDNSGLLSDLYVKSYVLVQSGVPDGLLPDGPFRLGQYGIEADGRTYELRHERELYPDASTTPNSKVQTVASFVLAKTEDAVAWQSAAAQVGGGRTVSQLHYNRRGEIVAARMHFDKQGRISSGKLLNHQSAQEITGSFLWVLEQPDTSELLHKTIKDKAALARTAAAMTVKGVKVITFGGENHQIVLNKEQRQKEAAALQEHANKIKLPPTTLERFLPETAPIESKEHRTKAKKFLM